MSCKFALAIIQQRIRNLLPQSATWTRETLKNWQPKISSSSLDYFEKKKKKKKKNKRKKKKVKF